MSTSVCECDLCGVSAVCYGADGSDYCYVCWKRQLRDTNPSRLTDAQRRYARLMIFLAVGLVYAFVYGLL